MTEMIRLKEIAHARSGDKGSHANIGIIAYTKPGYEYISRVLTETRIAEFFLAMRPREVQRYPLPGILAWNYVLKGVLEGGASISPRIDNQGKTLALAVLEMELPRPDHLEEMLRPKE